MRCAGAIVVVTAALDTHTSTSPRSGSGSRRRSARTSQPSARSSVTTSIPSVRRRSAIAAPIPRAAPVTNARMSGSSNTRRADVSPRARAAILWCGIVALPQPPGGGSDELARLAGRPLHGGRRGLLFRGHARVHAHRVALALELDARAFGELARRAAHQGAGG